MKKISVPSILVFVLFFLTLCAPLQTLAQTFDTFSAHPPLHTFMDDLSEPQGLTPAAVKAAYHLPLTGGSDTIAIISAFHHSDVANDLASFDTAFNLRACTVANGCLEIHPVTSSTRTDSGWDMETALDTEWAHAIAPRSKILLVEAENDSGSALMKALDYATSRKDVVSVSMSWGGGEFSGEVGLDSHFSVATNGKRAFFASSGDDGAGTSWPAVSPKVIAVGGTKLVTTKSVSRTGKVSYIVQTESAWSGSGGGVSEFEKQPTYQSDYSIPRSGGMRTIPDVSYAADPVYGFSVYHRGSWSIVGGTSAGAPQWAAIHALGRRVTPAELYADKAATTSASFFRDIVSGKNGSCSYFCAARKRYDYVTGLGSPMTYRF